MKPFFAFLCDQDGAITVDWVVLTCSAIGLAVFGYASMSDVVSDVTALMNLLLSTEEVTL